MSVERITESLGSVLQPCRRSVSVGKSGAASTLSGSSLQSPYSTSCASRTSSLRRRVLFFAVRALKLET